MKETEKRKQCAYKVRGSFYEKAKTRARKESGTLANLLENVVIAYSYGLDIKAISLKSGSGSAVDIFAEDFAEKVLAIKKNK